MLGMRTVRHVVERLADRCARAGHDARRDRGAVSADRTSQWRNSDTWPHDPNARPDSVAPHPAPVAAPARSRLPRHRRQGPSAGSALPRPPADRISIDDFMKVELRVATVLSAERVPKSEEAAEAAGRHRHRSADDRRWHRRGLRTGSARRPIDRHRRQPAAGQADGHRVERDGARRQPRRRQAGARQLRRAAAARHRVR